MSHYAKRTLQFLSICFSLSYGSAALFHFSGLNYQKSGTLFAIFYMFIPLFSALAVQLLHKERPVFRNLSVGIKWHPWYLLAIFFPLVLVFLTIPFNLFFPEVSFSPSLEGYFDKLEGLLPAAQYEEMLESLDKIPIPLFWLTAISGVFAGATINAIPAFGEELGWRGFLMKYWKGKNVFVQSIQIGAVWGIWHAPLILMGHNYPAHPQWGVLMMVAWCVLLSPFFSYVRVKTGSVIPAAMMHGVLNGLAGLAIMPIAGGSDLQVGVTGFAGFMSCFFLLVLLVIYDVRLSNSPVFFSTSTPTQMENPIGGHH